MATAVAAALLLWFVLEVPSASFHNSWLWAAVTAVTFACAAWLVRAVSRSGALAGAVVAFVFCTYGGFHLFFVLLLVFLLTWTATLAGRRQKITVEGEGEQSRRTAAQIMANLGVSTMALVICTSLASGFEFALSGAAVAALAEAAADTVSSEMGKAYGRKTVLITNFHPCPPGTDGGVSWIGTMAGFGAGLATVAVAMLGRYPAKPFVIATASASLGMCADSLAGAIWERHGKMGNNAVNLIGTGTAALVAWVLLRAA